MNDAPILSERPGSVTTIWRDGDVVRTDAWGRSRVLAPVAPVRESLAIEATENLHGGSGPHEAHAAS